MSQAPSRRVFFALWPDEAQRSALVRATAKTVRHSGGRPVPDSNLHVTLAFLGSIPEPRLGELSAIARRTAATFPGGPLVIDLEDFDYWAKPQVLAAFEQREESRAAADCDVVALARILTTETAAAGFTPDLKPFRAHVTVARKVARAPLSIGMRKVRWTFDAFTLVESRTLPEGPVYSVVESFVLGSADKMRT